VFSSAFLTAQIVNIPDPNFKAALLSTSPTIDTNGDGEIQESEAAARTVGLSVQSSNISDLTGIEAFINIPSLTAHDNTISTPLDLSNNLQLEVVWVHLNEIPSINVSGLTQLEWLHCDYNDLTELDVTSNPNLRILETQNNNIASFDLSQNINLIMLSAGSNPITTLDVSNNLELRRFSLYNVDWIEELDLSNNLNLCSVAFRFNPSLRFVNLNNGANELLVEGSNCSNAPSGIYAWENPVLEYICVDDIAFAEANFFNIPAQTQFQDGCRLSITDFDLAEVKLYPNPASNIFTIEANQSIDAIEIINILGQSLLYQDINSTEGNIDISHLAAGNYFVKITIEANSEMYQIIKE
jgi:hypothetical protein